MNVFDKGGAAFARVWGGAPITRIGLSRHLHWRSSLAQSKTGYTNIPGGPMGGEGTLGGSGLAVSQHSLHRKEAIDLVRFLIRAQIHSNQVEESAIANQPEIYKVPSVSDLHNLAKQVGNRAGVVTRPSSETGAQYEQVTRAYIDAVHSVLSGEKSAPETAAALEKKLVQITGFKTGPPLKVD